MKIGSYLKINFDDFLNESVNVDGFEFTDEQMDSAHSLFLQVYDKYLRVVSKEGYPKIYHSTSIDNFNSIQEKGLVNKLNYFMEYDNEMLVYGEFDEPGIVCVVDYREFKDQLFVDPEWLIDIIKIAGNPETFKERGIDHRIISCLWVTKVMNLSIDATIKDIKPYHMIHMVENNLFCWVYIKGEISPEHIDIKIHPDLI